jgi:hypothetical protein
MLHQIIIDQKAWRGEIHDYLKTPNGEREVDLFTCVAKLLLQFIGNRTRGLLFCNRHGQQLDQRNVLRRLHKALEEIGFEQAGWGTCFSSFFATHSLGTTPVAQKAFATSGWGGVRQA